MSVSTRILLFAAVAIGVICVLAASLTVGARMGGQIREQVVSSQEQLEILGRLDDGVWPFLNALSRARQQGQDTAAVLREQQVQVLAERARIDASLEREERAEGGVGRVRQQERAEVSHALETLLRWMESTEKRLRQEPERTSIAPAVEWALYQDYEETVGQYIDSLRRAEQEELMRRRQHWNANVERSQFLGTVITVVCVVIMVVMALSILVPLRRSLRKLRVTAEHIGRGDFEVSLPAMGQDELGLLARAMDRMALELRGTLQEKQRLIKAEAEVSEREARRYSAMLEETVRARTPELQGANARLEESLRQLQAAQEQLLFADRLATVGRLAAGVGHEINNPLSYILSNLRFIRKELEQDEEATTPERQEVLEAAAAAHEGAERVRLIVQELRMMSRPDDVALGRVELGSVVRGAVKLASRELRDRAQLVEDCEGIPAIWANGPRLSQVVLNLLINAAHAIPPGKPMENEVRVVARANGAGSVVLEVRDTGCGIPPENLERIFEPFFTTKPIGEGTGLGLSVCHNIITAMGGSIHVESKPGRGTTFLITLPEAAAHETAPVLEKVG
jgi:two-component system, NtrC family, sensor kinase